MRDGDLARIDALLEAWGRWAVSARYGLGYSRRNIIDRCMRQGAVGASIRRPFNSPMSVPGAVERTERAVAQLPEHLRAPPGDCFVKSRWGRSVRPRVATAFRRLAVSLGLLFPDVVERRGEVGMVVGGGLVGFRQVCRIPTNFVNCVLVYTDRVRNLLLRITSQPQVEDALVARVLAVLVDAR